MSGAVRGCVAALGLVLAGWPLAAVAQSTAITPDTVPGLGLGTTVGQSGRVFTIDGGTRAGANLFHSFAGFDLSAGDTARWSRAAGDGAEIGNVVNRVTGGGASHISGVLDSTALPNASFYFVNPAGIVFGAGAQVNVPSAAYFSTAAEVRFADGARFATATPGGSTLSVAAPESFGFVGGQGAIAIEGADLTFAPFSARLSLSASDVSITGSRLGLGGFDVVAVGDQAGALSLADPLAAARGGRVSVSDSAISVLTGATAGAPLRIGAGKVELARSNLLTDSAGAGRGGDLVLEADHIAIAPDAFVLTSARGSGAGGDLLVRAGVIDADATGGAASTGLSSTATGAGGAGRVRLEAGAINLAGGVFVGSTASGPAASGDVLLIGDAITVNSSLIGSTALGDGAGSDVRLVASAIDLGGANIFTSAFGAGRPGDVHVDGGTILVSGGALGSTPGGARDSGNLFVTATESFVGEGLTFSAGSFSASRAGRIELRAPSVELHDSRLLVQAFTQGGAGQLLVEGGTLVFDEVTVSADVADGPDSVVGEIRLKSSGDLVLFNSNVTSNSTGSSNAGRISIEGRAMQLSGSTVSSTTFASGDAGQVSIVADSLDLSNAEISSSSFGEGAGSNVTLTARTIAVANESKVHSDAYFLGDAGRVSVKAETLDIREGSEITSEAFSGTGDAGTVEIDAGRLTMTDVAVISSTSLSLGDAGSVVVRADEIDLDGQGRENSVGIVSDALSLGAGGDVSIDARTIVLRGEALISSASYSEAHAGDISIRVDDLSILTGGGVVSVGYFAGDSGNVSIEAGKILVKAEPGLDSFISSSAVSGGQAGDVTLKVGALLVDAGVVSSDTFAGGDAGAVRIDADAITLKNGGGVSSTTNSVGAAGSIEISAKTLTLEAGALVLSASTSVADGDGGRVTVAADQVVVGKGASITTATFGRGDAGGVEISAKSLRLDGGEVSSAAEIGASGRASEVRIAADDLTIVNGGRLSTLSANPNRAGEIDVAAGQVTVDGAGSIISSENLSTTGGDAFRISLAAANLRVANGGAISTNSVAGAAGDIDIGVPRPGLVILEGAELPGVIQTSSGPGTGGVITIADPLAVISNGGSILALGEQGGANVRIQSRYFIQSSDRLNRIDVAGDVKLDTGIYDVSSGTVSRDLSVLDASKVLRGQCPAARSTGAVSQLITRPVGPYAREPLTLGPSPAPAIAAAAGACP